MALVTCDYCLGEGSIFNGKNVVLCPICKGDCVVQDYDQDEPKERFFPDDREPFDENTIYTDD